MEYDFVAPRDLSKIIRSWVLAACSPFTSQMLYITLTLGCLLTLPDVRYDKPTS